MDEKVRWTIWDEHGHKIGKMEAEGHLTAECTCMFVNVYVASQY
jgi:hypothetical protein